MLDLRQLRQFVAVAETEHVGRAAEALHISQSPLSRQVMQLEAALGLALFERNRKRIHLTRDGQAFLVEARALLAQAEQVEARARRVAQGQSGTLAIGYVDGAVHAGVLPGALRRLAHSEVHIELRALRSAAQIEALRRREIDCGVAYAPCPENDPDLVAQMVFAEPMVLALPAGHPLARRPDISPANLDGQPWIDRPRALNPGAHDQLVQNCIAAGFTPDLRFESTDPATSLGLVGAGVGFALVQASMRRLAPPDVIFRELPWFPGTIRLFGLWRRHSRSLLANAFIAGLALGGP